MTLLDRVVVMRHGKVHQIGESGTIYTKPADTFVATFIWCTGDKSISGSVFPGHLFSNPLVHAVHAVNNINYLACCRRT